MIAYVTEAEAETYFEDDPRAEDFLAADFAWYLTQATRIIDRLTLRGQKYDTDIVAGVAVQPLQFPRIIDGVTCDWNDSTDLPIVPQAVKDACCEEALEIYLQGTSGGRQALQAQGVASYQIPGIISETFNAAAVSAAMHSTLQSSAAMRYMRRYTGAEVR